MTINHRRVQIHGRRGGICVLVSSLAILPRFSVLSVVGDFSSTAMLLYGIACSILWMLADLDLWCHCCRNNWSGFCLIRVLLVGFWFFRISFEFWKPRPGLFCWEALMLFASIGQCGYSSGLLIVILFWLTSVIEFNSFDWEKNWCPLLPFSSLIPSFLFLDGFPGVKSQLEFLQQGLPGMCFYSTEVIYKLVGLSLFKWDHNVFTMSDGRL